LQGVHRSSSRLSVEEIVQRNKGKMKKESSGGRATKYSRKGVLELLIKSSGKIHSQKGEERSQTVRSGEVARRRTVKYFGTSEVRQVENLTKVELRSPKS
jgi:hypothetical protein